MQAGANTFPSMFECQGEMSNERAKGRASFGATVHGYYSSHQQNLDFLVQAMYR